LQQAYSLLLETESTSVLYEMYRSACIKEFEIILEQSGKLLKKALKPYFASARQVDALYFKDVFRHALKHGLLADEAEALRWLDYRDKRNDTAHEYGEYFAEATLRLLPQFIADVARLLTVLQHHQGESC
jgi:nucleotidyltransferase substrate binding protein (TIGR01987 family)